MPAGYKQVIKNLYLENFKSFSHKQRIKLAPVTLLFGPNSTGKSTIMEAMSYLCEVVSGNLDADITAHGGQALNLGGFKNIVNRKDVSKLIRIGLDIDLTAIDVEDYFLHEYTSEYKFDYKSLYFEVEISFNDSLAIETPYVSKIIYNYDDMLKFNLSSAGDFSKWNFMAQENIDDDINDNVQDYESLDYVLEAKKINSFIENKSKLGALPRYKKDDLIRVFEEISNQRTVYSHLEDGEPVPELDHNGNEVMDADLDVVAIELNKIYSNLIHLPLQLIRKCSENYRIVGPIREIPAKNFLPQKTRQLSRWYDGKAAWDALYRKDLPIETVNTSMNCLELGYDIVKREVDYDCTEVYLLDKNNNVKVLPENVGVGISQIIPVIIASMYYVSDYDFTKMVAIQQPELHVHPRIKSELADVFIVQAMDYGVPFLIETHSEHLILRLLRRIRETHSGNLEKDFPEFTKDDLSVQYISPPDKEFPYTRVQTLRVDEEGDFIEPWPGGFFEERDKDLMV